MGCVSDFQVSLRMYGQIFFQRISDNFLDEFYNLPTSTVTIKATLNCIFSAKQQHTAVNHLVQNCFKISLAYLHHRLRRGSLIDNQFGISNEDLALDCIAELYQRDETGCFIVLQHYFNTINWKSLSEEELAVALRRLVFSKVNEGLFRNYREEDPNLAKIIRNIKEAVKHNEQVNQQRIRETSWLVVGPENAGLNNLPLAPAEILESHFFSVICNTSNVYRAVDAFTAFINAHPYYRNGYPVSAFAQVLRSSYMNREVSETEAPEQHYEPLEVENAIQRSITFVRKTLYDSYVRRGKLSLALFDNYCTAVYKSLKSTFTLHPEATDSQFEALRTLIPDLSKDVYMNQHRNILQYLFKLSRTHMIAFLQEDA